MTVHVLVQLLVFFQGGTCLTAGRALRHSAFAPASSVARLPAVAAFGVATIPTALCKE